MNTIHNFTDKRLLIPLFIALFFPLTACNFNEVDNSLVMASVDGDIENQEADISSEYDWSTNPNEDGDTELEAEIDADEAEEAFETEENETPPPPEPNGFRLNHFSLFSPPLALHDANGNLMQDIAAEINEAISDRIQTRVYNLALHPHSTDIFALPYQAEFGYAELYGQRYELPEEDGETHFSADFTMDGADGSFASTPPESLTISLPEEFDLPLSLVILRGQITENGIETGLLEGVISAELCNELTFEDGSTLAAILFSMNRPPDYTFDDESKGYTFQFTYTAIPTLIVE